MGYDEDDGFTGFVHYMACEGGDGDDLCSYCRHMLHKGD